MIRFGLCCLFKNENIKFRLATARNLLFLEKSVGLDKLSELCFNNVKSLFKALEFINGKGIKAFRVSSRIFPLYTHSECGYRIEQLKDSKEILNTLDMVKKYAKINDIRLSFHPDQFVLLSSPDPEILKNSLYELDYQAMVAELIGADVINIHLGGSYGNKTEVLKRVEKNFNTKLHGKVKELLTFENDDKIYTSKDVYEICKRLEARMVYDVHHHRCNSDGLSIEEATDLCISTWKGKGEPYFHISSPKYGWESKHSQGHSDYINIADFPAYWLELKQNITVDIEAKNKELAVFKLMKELNNEKGV